jgi:hypothetical protein
MALDAVRHPTLPDHGLVSTYHAYQPPGLVWTVVPFVALGGGRPEFAIVAFGLLNAAAIGFLAATACRAFGARATVVTSAFLVVGPDAFMSGWVWHPSLYTGAMAVLIAAAIRLEHGSRWWATVILAVPGLYALIHYSGFVLYGPSLALLALARRRPRTILPCVTVALVVTAVAWTPFLVFEAQRHWADILAISDQADTNRTLGAKLDARVTGARFALTHLGEALHGSVLLTPLIEAGAAAAVALALVRRRLPRAVVIPGAVLATGLLLQVATNMAHRTDVLLLWLLPLYALAGWCVGQARLGAVAVPLAAVAVLAVGGIDLQRAVAGTAPGRTLAAEWRAARAKAAVAYDPTLGNRLYLACDPPYDWGSETWYLEEVLRRGDGIAAAAAAGAFRVRKGTCAARR